MGLKVLSPLIKTVAKKAYVAPKMEVRTLESLGLKTDAGKVLGDFLSSRINTSESFNQIKELIIQHAPVDKQESLIKKFNDFANNESGLNVLESLFEGIKISNPNLTGKNLIRNYNRYFNRIKTLQNNNPEEFQLMIDGGFFDLVKQGKICPNNFKVNMTNARISRALLDDLRKVANGEDFVPDLSNLSFEEIRNLVKNGETYLKGGKLFVNRNGVVEEITLSKEKFLELFPPVLRNISKQGQIGNCWVVGQLDNMITSESGRAGLFKLFRQQGDDIFIRFPNCEKEVLFPKGKILTTKKQKQMTTIPGLAMIEQALAVHSGNRYAKGAITNIEHFSKNPDQLMNNLNGINFTNPILLIKDIFRTYKKIFSDIFGHGGKPLQDISSSISGEIIDDIQFIGSNAYTRNTLIERIKSLFSFNHNRKIMQNIIDNQANNSNLHIGIDFKLLTPKKYGDLYNMLPQHQLTLKGVDGNMCYLSNPWFTWIEKGVNKETLLKYIKSMQVPMVWE